MDILFGIIAWAVIIYIIILVLGSTGGGGDTHDGYGGDDF